LTAVVVLVLVGAGGGCAGRDGEDGPRSSPAAPARVVPAAVPAAQAAALGLTRRLPRTYRDVCAEWAASVPPAAQPCPPLIPRGGVKVIVAALFSRQRRYRGGYLSDLASRSLSTLRGRPVATNGGHWHVDVSWTAAVRELLVRRGIERPVNADVPSRCRRLRLGGQPVEACRVVPYEQGGGLSGGHVAYVWRRGAVTRVVSLHGYANAPRARTMLAAWMRAVLRDKGQSRRDR
jgi:hypothetical protein